MKKLLNLFICLLVTGHSSFSQSIGIGTITPNASAQLEISSNSKGILIPRLTTLQKDAISLPAEGLMIYNTTDSTFYVFKTRWRKMGITLPYTDTVAHNQYGVNIVNTGGGTALRGTVTSNFTTAVSGTSASFGIGVSGSSVDGGSGVSGQSSGYGSGVAGSNADANGNGVYGQSTGSGTGVYGNSLFGTGGKFNSTFGNALVTTGPVKMNGSIQLQGMGEATGRILTCDAQGNASWVILSKIQRLSIPAATFRTLEFNESTQLTSEGEISGSGRSTISAPVSLPDGANITGVFFEVFDGNNTTQIVGKFYAYQNGSAASTLLATGATSLAYMGGYTSFNMAANHTVDNSLNSYAVVAYAYNGAQTFWQDLRIESVIITYTYNVN